MAVRYSLWSFGIFFPFWYVGTKKNLATLATRFQSNYQNFQIILSGSKKGANFENVINNFLGSKKCG
jgi:hypothetical protein